jgi:GGDEF domain-containing protein
MSERWVLLDQETGLHVAWYFWLRVLDEVNRSARYGAPFALLLLTAEHRPDAPRRSVVEAAASVPACIRSTDLGGRIGAGRVGVLLMHQEAESARSATERILGRLEGGTRKPSFDWSARLLCYPEDAAEISNLLTTGGSEHRDGDIREDLELPA